MCCMQFIGSQRVGSLHQVAKILELQLQNQLVLLVNIWADFPLRLTGLISLQSKGLLRVFSNTTVQKHQFFHVQPSFMVQHSDLYMPTGKTRALTIQTFVGKVMSLLFNMMSRFVNWNEN